MLSFSTALPKPVVMAMTVNSEVGVSAPNVILRSTHLTANHYWMVRVIAVDVLTPAGPEAVT